MSVLFTLAVIGLSIGLLVLYGRLSNDPTPDSFAGYTYAIVGSFFMFLAALDYARRRSRERRVGQLNGSLQWHISFGIIALVLLFLHSFGNFNPRSGTYALWGMIALVVSGIIGRFLDRVVPKLIAQQVKQALTEQGEDRIEHHTRTIQSIVTYNKQELRSLKSSKNAMREAKKPLMTAWDLAYISLEETPQELRQNETHYRFVPDRKSDLDKPETLMPGVGEHLKEMHGVQLLLQLAHAPCCPAGIPPGAANTLINVCSFVGLYGTDAATKRNRRGPESAAPKFFKFAATVTKTREGLFSGSNVIVE